ncbi:MAG: tRNA uridine-5-carboxymethylaminomethyl(34) synthesis enzyme MnmG [Clostridiales bacterium]|jgi:tRNA uridine 5-carboxymethylaminomethyl modification enzyme|nr:tRNA uridine-5-carboxymethylaminomethyl(34) synthesis enzyme MnmG [Clostridiales bacterium]
MRESGSWDAIVVGGGHAGCEAALAASRLGMKVLMFAISLDSIAMMPCNPNIGGTSKGHLVREIDALGGEMGKNIDKTFIQSRMLNTSKGPAMLSLRAQADKAAYSRSMRQVLESEENLAIRQSEVTAVRVDDTGKVIGVETEYGAFHRARAVVLCCGTYLASRCLCGETIIESGPNGLRTAKALSGCLRELGFRLQRFKTGTPARIDGSTIDYSKMIPQYGDEWQTPFSFSTDPGSIQREQVLCYLAYTNEATHEAIRRSLDRSPMYSGAIKGTGARYCPSIEDKVVRFADKPRHQVFIEPEGESTNEMYVSGMSTSMPEDVQEEMYRSLSGMESCRLTRNGYAIEYDCLDSTELRLSLESRKWSGLFCAGQINGSSGYEEAAAQGLVAGINAARWILGKEPIIIKRSEGYIGVLIDDLITKGTSEPYRMMTSRAEYRLLLRQDNADLRLTELGHEAGLVTEERLIKVEEKKNLIEKETARAKKKALSPSVELNALLAERGSTPVATGIFLSDLAKRPELSYQILAPFDSDRPSLDPDTAEQVNIQLKYEGYIKRQMDQVEQFKKLEGKVIPEGLDYNCIKGLRVEARQKLSSSRPASVGQASRISGVSPADISVLVYFIANMGKA